MKQILLSLLVLMTTEVCSGQILGRIMDRAMDKVEDEVTDMLVERITDEIARAAMRPIDKAIDDMLRERYRQDSISGKTNDGSYNDFLGSFLTPVDLPPSYTFEIILDVETTDYDKDKSEMQLLLSKNTGLIGFVQPDEEYTMMIMDSKNNTIAMYGEDKGKKTVIAMPSMISEATAIAAINSTQEQSEFTYEFTGKTKQILGYKCDQMKFEDETTRGEAWIAKDFPVEWKDYFGELMTVMAPTTTRDAEAISGMMLESVSKTKKKGKKSTFKVVNISEEPFTVDNTAYEKIDYTDQ